MEWRCSADFSSGYRVLKLAEEDDMKEVKKVVFLHAIMGRIIRRFQGEISNGDALAEGD